MTTQHTCWLWPDQVLSKRDSRRLREQHNALYNSYVEAIEACKLAQQVIGGADTSGSGQRQAHAALFAVIARAENKSQVA